jgi:hypothetical protein
MAAVLVRRGATAGCGWSGHAHALFLTGQEMRIVGRVNPAIDHLLISRLRLSLPPLPLAFILL